MKTKERRGLTEKPVRTPGGQPVLSADEENMFVAHAIAMSTYGFPITTFELRCVVKSYLDRMGRNIRCFKNNIPGPDWANSFMRRHQTTLSQRTSKNISYSRAANDEEVINLFFSNLEKELNGVPPDNVWNYDETNLVDDPGSQKVITRRGTKYPEQIRNASKACTSIMICGNAAGLLAPIYVNYKAEKLWSTWTENGPEGARYNRTKSGWFDHQVFEDWFVSLMLPILKKQEGVKVIIGDNLSSHINLEVIRLCEENNIKFIALPPNATHLLQPLDVAFFRPMKSHWRHVLSSWKKSLAGSRCTSIPKDQFPTLLGKLMDALEAGREQNLKAGFRKTGIFPLNKNEVLQRMPSVVLSNDLGDLHKSVGEVFLQELQSRREELVSKRTVKRRKKMNVPPGKSIGLSDLEQPPTNDSSTNEASTPLVVPRNVSTEPDTETEDESDAFSLQDSDASLNLNFSDEDLDSAINNDTNATQQANSNFMVEDYVVVNFEGELFPGKVTQRKDGGYMVSAMAKSGMNWKWPRRPDEIYYTEQEVLKRIEAPKQISTRGIYQINDLSCDPGK